MCHTGAGDGDGRMGVHHGQAVGYHLTIAGRQDPGRAGFRRGDGTYVSFFATGGDLPTALASLPLTGRSHHADRMITGGAQPAARVRPFCDDEL